MQGGRNGARGAVEHPRRDAARRRVRRLDRGHSGGPEGAPPPVAERRLIRPTAVDRHAVVGETARIDRALQEPEGGAGHLADEVGLLLRMHRDEERARHIVHAVAVFSARHVEERVLEHAGRVGQALEVAVARWGSPAERRRVALRHEPGHTATGCRSSVASSRYRRATSPQVVSAVATDAATRIRSARPCSVRIDRTASAIAVGSSCGDDDAGPRLEQLLGVREGGGDDGDACSDRLDEHAGRDLVTRVVRQEDDIGRGDRCRRARPARGSGRRAAPTP